MLPLHTLIAALLLDAYLSRMLLQCHATYEIAWWWMDAQCIADDLARSVYVLVTVYALGISSCIHKTGMLHMEHSLLVHTISASSYYDTSTST